MPAMNRDQRRVAPHVQEVSANHRRRVAQDVADGGHQAAPFRESGVAGEGQEDVVEVRASGPTARRPRSTPASSSSSRLRSEPTPPSLGTSSASDSSSRARPANARAAFSSSSPSANSRRMCAARDEPLELRRRALGDDPAVVEDRDPIGEPVRLLEVLRGQEDRDAAVDEVADDLPHRPAAARIEPGRRLVEEDDPGIADEGHREVELALHPARQRRRPACARHR